MSGEAPGPGVEQLRPEVLRIQGVAESIRYPSFVKSPPLEDRPAGKLWPEVQTENGKPVLRTRDQVKKEYVVKLGNTEVPLVDYLDKDLKIFLTVLTPAETANLTASGVLVSDENGTTTIAADPEKRMQLVGRGNG